MSLRDYNWQGYYPGHANILEEFFIPALKHSTKYDRITGNFSSSVFALFTEGLKTFIENGGTIRLIPGIELRESDIEAINQGRSEEVLRDQINWSELKSGAREAELEALAWMISEDILKIRIGVVTDSRGRLQSKQEAEWHQKIAIFRDDDENAIGITGSPNESFKALQRNRESFALFRNWVNDEDIDWDEGTKLQDQINEFNQLWKDDDPASKVFDFPDALRRDLIDEVSLSEPDWDDLIQDSGVQGREEISLRPYQDDAINEFLRNNNRIILDHATGTGKTWTSLLALQNVVENEDIVVVFAPTQDLVNQWVKDDNIPRFFPDGRIIRCLGGSNWRERLRDHLLAGRSSPLFIVSTMHPSTMEDMISLVEELGDEEKVSVIADEVHNLGSNLRRTIFPDLKAGRGRVALSATPFRDDKGDDAILSYFGGEIHEVTIQDAIEEYDVLSDYEYHIHPVTLSSTERQRFQEHSDEISHLYNMYKSYEDQPVIEVSDRHPDLKTEIMKRAGLVKECSEKLEVVNTIIDDVGTRTIVYCNTECHTKDVVEAVDDHTTQTVSIFLGKQSSTQKNRLLKHFEGGDVDVLVSIDCLTEGIDVPDCDSAILITSSTTEREAVQRRGRILREAESDDPAQLHDFLTLPVELEKIKEGSADLESSEISLIKRELERLQIMNADAANKMKNDPLILRLSRATTQYDLE